MTARSNSAIQTSDAVPTCYKIHSRESIQRSWWPFTALLVPIVAVTADSLVSGSETSTKLQQYYKTYRTDNLVVGCAISLAVALLYIAHYLFSTRNYTRDVDLSLTICPLGVQPSKTTTTTYNGNSDHQKVDVHISPLLPIEAVKDCILLEHVGGFSVTTHVMIRLNAKAIIDDKVERTNSDKEQRKEDAASGMVLAFPDATLTFAQCHDLVKKIGRAIEEMQ